MAIKEIFGDLTKCPIPLIAHQVNCQGVMGAGLARQIREKWPRVYEEYRATCAIHKGNTLLGSILVSQPDQHRTIVNMFSQDKYGHNARYTDYEAFATCCERIKEYMMNNDLDAIAFPKYIGCGLAGGDWKVIRAIIESTLADDVEVYIYEL